MVPFKPLVANVIPQVTVPIRRAKLDSQKHPALSSLPLAEPPEASGNRLTIDVLVGLDFYYTIIGADRLSFPDGLHLLDSSLGFICAGTVDSRDGPVTAEANLVVTDPGIENNPEFDLERFWAV